jgi:hypothetical protein
MIATFTFMLLIQSTVPNGQNRTTELGLSAARCVMEKSEKLDDSVTAPETIVRAAISQCNGEFHLFKTWSDTDVAVLLNDTHSSHEILNRQKMVFATYVKKIEVISITKILTARVERRNAPNQ